MTKQKAIALLTVLAERAEYFGDSEYCYAIALSVFSDTLNLSTKNLTFSDLKAALIVYTKENYGYDLSEVL